MTGEDHQAKRNRKAIVSMMAGILSSGYSTFFVGYFWIGLTFFDTDLLVLGFPIFLFGSLAIVLASFSLYKIRLSKGLLEGKIVSIVGLVLGVLSFALIFLPRCSFMVAPILKPANYQVTLQLQETPAHKITPDMLKEVEEAISSRFQELSAHCETMTSAPDKIIVRFRVGDAFSEEYIQKMFESHVLSFHLVHEDSDNIVQHLSEPNFSLPEGYKTALTGKDPMIIKTEPELLDNVESARVKIDSSSIPYISIRFNSQGADKFQRVTQDNVGKRLAIVVDEKILSAPVVREPIYGGAIIIEGNFTLEEAKRLAAELKMGVTPVPIRVVEQRHLEK